MNAIGHLPPLPFAPVGLPGIAPLPAAAAPGPLYQAAPARLTRLRSAVRKLAMPARRQNPQVMQAMSHDARSAVAEHVWQSRWNLKLRAINLAFQSVGLGMCVALTVATFGATAPLLALAGTTFALSIADTACALYDYRQAKALENGTNANFKRLPLSSNSLGNLFYAALTKLGVSEEAALRVAAFSSAIIRVGLIVSSVALTFDFTTAFLPTMSAATVAPASVGVEVLTDRNNRVNEHLVEAANAATEFYGVQAALMEVGLPADIVGFMTDPAPRKPTDAELVAYAKGAVERFDLEFAAPMSAPHLASIEQTAESRLEQLAKSAIDAHMSLLGDPEALFQLLDNMENKGVSRATLDTFAGVQHGAGLQVEG